MVSRHTEAKANEELGKHKWREREQLADLCAVIKQAGRLQSAAHDDTGLCAKNCCAVCIESKNQCDELKSINKKKTALHQ